MYHTVKSVEGRAVFRLSINEYVENNLDQNSLINKKKALKEIHGIAKSII